MSTLPFWNWRIHFIGGILDLDNEREYIDLISSIFLENAND